jgi:hypothetical protein
MSLGQRIRNATERAVAAGRPHRTQPKDPEQERWRELARFAAFGPRLVCPCGLGDNCPHSLGRCTLWRDIIAEYHRRYAGVDLSPERVDEELRRAREQPEPA